MDDKITHAWHVKINAAMSGSVIDPQSADWMYTAKNLAEESERLPKLFRAEREGTLPKIHRQCSHDEAGTAISDNHLTCCLGVECRDCPFLRALETPEIAPAALDQIKAWTCIAHILHEQGKSGDAYDLSEGMILTNDDRLYWDQVYRSMAGDDE